MNSPEDQQEPHPKLETALTEAMHGAKDSAKVFFSALLEGPLFVPDRHQAAPLSDAPPYPNDFVHILGIQDKDRVIVPVFSDQSYIEKWCGNELTFRTYTGEKLFTLMPEEWWISVNPGQNIEKELSPWEIQTLRGGDIGIEEVLDELFTQEMIEPLHVAPVTSTDYPKLQKLLLDEASVLDEVSKIFLLKEHGKDLEGEEISQVLVGIEIAVDDPKLLENVGDQVKAIVGRAQIGDDPAKVLIGNDAEYGVALGVFKGTEPLYSS